MRRLREENKELKKRKGSGVKNEMWRKVMM